MTKENKDLLLKYLCMALPYGVKANIPLIESDKRIYTISFSEMDDFKKGHITITPYLRPMSSMTNEEEFEYHNVYVCPINNAWNVVDWLLEHHFDFMGLIPKDLAIEVTEENNPYGNS